jgi:hypothetical protein
MFSKNPRSKLRVSSISPNYWIEAGRLIESETSLARLLSIVATSRGP